MPVPRHPLHPALKLYNILIYPLSLFVGFLRILYTILLIYLLLPWTLYYSSSNWGLSSQDNELALGWVGEVERKSREEGGDLDTLLRALRRPGYRALGKVYPYHTGAGATKIARLEEGSWGKGFTAHPKLVEVLLRLEMAGWGRGRVWDMFISLARAVGTGTNTANTNTEIEKERGINEERVKELEGIKTKACTGQVLPLFAEAFHPDARAYSLLEVEGKPNMLRPPAQSFSMKFGLEEGRRKVEVLEIDVRGSAEWILSKGAVIRPKDGKTLRALEELDRDFGVWKFVGEEEGGDGLREMGWWQYVVL